MRFFPLVIIALLAACGGPKLPAPNSADVRYADASGRYR